MAGNLKPNIADLGEEVEISFGDYSVNAGSPQGLVDGIEGAYNANTCYVYYSGTYFTVNIPTKVRIWHQLDTIYWSSHYQPFIIKKKQKDGSYLDITSEIKQPVTMLQPPNWEVAVEELEAGEYRFEPDTSKGGRMDGEWYVEALEKPKIVFNKYLKDNIPTNNIPFEDTFIFDENNMIYTSTKEGLIKPIYSQNPQSETVLFEGSISTGEITLTNDINNYDFLNITIEGNSFSRVVPYMTSQNDKGFEVLGSPSASGYNMWALFSEIPSGLWMSTKGASAVSGRVTFPEPKQVTQVSIASGFDINNYNLTMTKQNGEIITLSSGSYIMSGDFPVPKDYYTSCQFYIAGHKKGLEVRILNWSIYNSGETQTEHKVLVKNKFNTTLTVFGTGELNFVNNKAILKDITLTGNIKIVGVKKERF